METKISQQELEIFFKACVTGDANRVRDLIETFQVSFYQFNQGFQIAAHHNKLDVRCHRIYI